MSNTFARSLNEWKEEFGSVLWWKFPIKEAPYVGSPLDEDFPEYVTHWTRIEVPEDPNIQKDWGCDGCWENSNYPEDQCTMHAYPVHTHTANSIGND
jgi:hypothetical protein